MKMNWSELEGTKIRATDGDVGKLKDLYFDDESFKVRFALVETGGILSRKWALISPQAFGAFEPQTKRLPINLSKSKIEKSPDVSDINTLRNEDQKAVCDYFGWATNWYGRKGDLRVLQKLLQCKVLAEDEKVGGLDDVILDLNVWSVQSLVLNAGSWLSGKKILVPTQKVKSFTVEDNIVSIDMTRDRIEEAPDYNPEKHLKSDQKIERASMKKDQERRKDNLKSNQKRERASMEKDTKAAKDNFDNKQIKDKNDQWLGQEHAKINLKKSQKMAREA